MKKRLALLALALVVLPLSVRAVPGPRQKQRWASGFCWKENQHAESSDSPLMQFDPSKRVHWIAGTSLHHALRPSISESVPSGCPPER